jgi:hypothetical protein
MACRYLKSGIKSTLVFMAGSLAVWLPSAAMAYPVLIPAKDIPWMMGTKRAEILAFSKGSDGAWRAIPSQSEEIEDDVAIVFRKPTQSLPIRQQLRRPKERDPFEGYFEKYHRIILNDADFGTCDALCQSEARLQAERLCTKGNITPYSRLARIDLEFNKTTAFLVDCQSPQKPFPPSPTTVDQKTFELGGADFSFNYKRSSSVMLDRFKVGAPADRKDVLVGTEMKVFLKPRFMFNLEFANDDVHAEISSITHGPLSHGVEIATALNVMIFQFNKQICCDINIFADSIYFPVMLDMPYGGESFVDGSGLFYGFGVTEGTNFEYFPAKPGDTKNGQHARSATAMTLSREDKIVTVGFGNLKAKDGSQLAPERKGKVQMAAKGFGKLRNQDGLFYDVTKLPEGFNYFTVWLYVGDTKDKEKLLEYARYSVRYNASRVF